MLAFFTSPLLPVCFCSVINSSFQKKDRIWLIILWRWWLKTSTDFFPNWIEYRLWDMVKLSSRCLLTKPIQLEAQLWIGKMFKNVGNIMYIRFRKTLQFCFPFCPPPLTRSIGFHFYQKDHWLLQVITMITLWLFFCYPFSLWSCLFKTYWLSLVNTQARTRVYDLSFVVIAKQYYKLHKSALPFDIYWLLLL